MIVVLRPDARAAEVAAITEKVKRLGCDTMRVDGAERSVLAVLGNPGFSPDELRELPGVSDVLRVGKPYKLASVETRAAPTLVRVGDLAIGGPQVVVMAGPPSVESREMLLDTARFCAELGVTILRGGAFHGGGSPYGFQGLGEEALRLLSEARDATGLKVVTEVTSREHLEQVVEHADIVQIGARHMHNAPLLDAVARIDVPVLLKRGLGATIDEWLVAAETILAPGVNERVILCERGIRTYERATGNTLDLSAVPILKRRTHLPVVVDPSQGTGARAYVAPMARAAIAAGADGVMVVTHPDPPKALTGGPRSLYFEQLRELVRDLQTIAPVVGRRLDLTTTRPPKRPVREQASAEVAFQGEPGAFSELASRQVFGPDAPLRPLPSFRKVFEAVEAREVAFGVVPVENTLGGSIHENFDHLHEHEVTIVGETKLKVVHNLIGNRGSRLEDVRRVYAHPQAAAQCTQFLRRHPDWTVYQVYDTAGSVKMIRDEGLMDGAGIARADVAAQLGMVILAESIESHPENYTRFLVIARDAEPNPAADKTSLVYTTADHPGALLETLQVFATHRVNLSRLESRPVPGRPWEYRFYVDLAGTPTEAMLEDLRVHCRELDVLGVYPAA